MYAIFSILLSNGNEPLLLIPGTRENMSEVPGTERLSAVVITLGLTKDLLSHLGSSLFPKGPLSVGLAMLCDTFLNYFGKRSNVNLLSGKKSHFSQHVMFKLVPIACKALHDQPLPPLRPFLCLCHRLSELWE